MLLKKSTTSRFETEIAMECWTTFRRAGPRSCEGRHIAGSRRAESFLGATPANSNLPQHALGKIQHRRVKGLEPGKWEAVHARYNVAFMNKILTMECPSTRYER